MNLSIQKNRGIVNTPAKDGDAGYDIFAVSEPRIQGSMYQGPYYTSIHYIEYDTEIRIEPNKVNDEHQFYMLLYPRSSIIHTNLVLANSVGVIDSGYRGNIKVCFKYISQPEDLKIIEGKSVAGKKANGILTSVNPQRIYHEGDKIAQLIPCNHNKISIDYVDELSNTERGDGGFGSTNKP
jgi:dUTP pyrophosphatase